MGEGTAGGAAIDPAVLKLQALIRIPTVSQRDPELLDTAAFDDFVDELERQFPLLHRDLELTRVHTHGLLFHWKGASDKRPVVLMAHLDVVRGFTPAQDVWLSFGCDEEVFGTAALQAVEELRRREVRPWFVLDEGGAIALEAFPGVSVPVGVIGVTEKGTMSIHLRVEGPGGHASTPTRMGPTARLARAIGRLDRSSMPTRLPEPTLELFRRMAPHAPLHLRPLLANAGRLEPAMARLLVVLGPEAAAMARTTFAVTTLSGSPALNVIAQTATAGVNIRIQLGDTGDDVLTHVRKVVNDDQVEIEVVERFEPSPISPYGADEAAFELVQATIGEVFPDAVPAPYVLTGATDASSFTAICERVYRFAPFRMTRAQRDAIHACDEHLGVDDYREGVRWYRRLIERLA
jgi:carboxypeptidase PM20D1